MKDEILQMNYSKWVNFNSFIQISKNGEIKSHGKIIKGEICKNGYKRIHVSNNGVQYKFLVHRLVAETFIPNPNNLPCVNHKDGNKLNNSVENLEWVSYSENQIHAYKMGLKSADGVKNGQHKLTEKDVLYIRKHYVKGKHCENNSYGLANKFGVSAKTIQQIVNGVTWKIADKLFEEEEQ